MRKCPTELQARPGAEKKIRVVLVEDSEETRSGLVRLLSTLAQVEIIGEAQDGPKGLEMAAKLQPDLVITDINMPGFDGFQLVRNLRRSHPNIRSIIISLHDGAIFQKISRQHGADAFLTKLRLAEELPHLLNRLFVYASSVEASN